MSVPIAEVITALQGLQAIDFPGAIKAIESQDIQGDLVTAEEVAGMLAPFFPIAEDVKLGLVLLGLVAHAYEVGWIQSASPDDPAMQHAAGPAHGGR